MIGRTKELFGITALFDNPDSIIKAAKRVVKEGYKKFDVNTPYPIHGMDKALGLKNSKVGFFTLFFGLSGTAFILLFMYWTMSLDYPLVIGGNLILHFRHSFLLLSNLLFCLQLYQLFSVW